MERVSIIRKRVRIGRFLLFDQFDCNDCTIMMLDMDEWYCYFSRYSKTILNHDSERTENRFYILTVNPPRGSPREGFNL